MAAWIIRKQVFLSWHYFFYYTHNLFWGIQIKISLKRHGDAKSHFSKGILSDLLKTEANYIFDASKIIIWHVVVWNSHIPESHVTNLDLCNIIGIDIQIFIDKGRCLSSMFLFLQCICNLRLTWLSNIYSYYIFPSFTHIFQIKAHIFNNEIKYVSIL